MFVLGRPGEFYRLAGRGPDKTVLPYRDRLALDVAKHDAVGAEMLDALYPGRTTVLRHDPDMLGPDPDEPAVLRDQVHRRGADEARGKRGLGPAVKRLRRAVLLDPAIPHQDDAVGHGHRLGLVVGDIDHGHAEALLQAADLGAHFVAQLGIEVGQRFVHQAQLRLGDDGAAERDALALAAGQLRRLAVQ